LKKVLLLIFGSAEPPTPPPSLQQTEEALGNAIDAPTKAGSAAANSVRVLLTWFSLFCGIAWHRRLKSSNAGNRSLWSSA
jgi:hypothetical protein